ncbi:MAG: HIT family protein [Euryarchaeota archaeon]|nr:HIT family protein [Euryarchaeota archaeon]
MTDACVFCAIIVGQRPGIIVFDDGTHVAIMDKHPITHGHTLVMPKAHARDMFHMAPADVGRLYQVAARVARAVKKATGADGLNVGQNNGASARQIVFHVHVHLIPRRPGDTTHHFPDRLEEPPEETLKVAEAIRKCLKEEAS